MLFSTRPLLRHLLSAALLAVVAAGARGQSVKPDPSGAPDQFVMAIANQAVSVLKGDGAVKAGNMPRINQVVDQYILPYVDFEKTTRLAAGRYWRQATDTQRHDLAQAFRGTLVRTYSGALTRVDGGTQVKLMPGRASDTQDDDAVVRTSIVPSTNAQPVEVDYRLAKSPQGWRVYDLNVEGVWLIENYRNQFAQQINQDGIDGLIAALKQRNTAN